MVWIRLSYQERAVQQLFLQNKISQNQVLRIRKQEVSFMSLPNIQTALTCEIRISTLRSPPLSTSKKLKR